MNDEEIFERIKTLKTLHHHLEEYLTSAGWKTNNVKYWVDPIESSVPIEHGILSAVELQMHRDWKLYN